MFQSTYVIETRSRLRNKYSKYKTEEMVSYILSEKNKFVSLMRKMKINYYGNLDEKDIADHKIF